MSFLWWMSCGRWKNRQVESRKNKTTQKKNYLRKFSILFASSKKIIFTHLKSSFHVQFTLWDTEWCPSDEQIQQVTKRKSWNTAWIHHQNQLLQESTQPKIDLMCRSMNPIVHESNPTCGSCSAWFSLLETFSFRWYLLWFIFVPFFVDICTHWKPWLLARLGNGDCTGEFRSKWS